MKTKNTTKEERVEAKAWLIKYNKAGYLGGNRLLALEAGMKYQDWMDQPFVLRERKRSEILREKRRLADLKWIR